MTDKKHYTRSMTDDMEIQSERDHFIESKPAGYKRTASATTDKMREIRNAHDEARDKAWREEPGTFDTLDAFKAGAAWQAAQSEAVPAAILDSRCTYYSFAGSVCNKCGRIHDGGKSVPVVGRSHE